MYQYDASIPLYLQIKEQLKQEIMAGAFARSQKIPNELELTQKYGVSRITIRKAIDALVDIKLLVKKQGKGTYIVKPQIERQITANLSVELFVTGFTEQMSQLNMKTSTRVVSVESLPPTELQREFLKLKINEPIILTKRIRCVNGEPVSYEINAFPGLRFGFLLEVNLADSLYDILAKRSIHPRHSSRFEISAMQAGADVGALLNVSSFEPILHQIALITDDAHAPIHTCEHYYMGTRYKFIVG